MQKKTPSFKKKRVNLGGYNVAKVLLWYFCWWRTEMKTTTEKTTMKKIKSNLLGCIVAMLVCLVGSQNALAVCKGTVVFQVPDGWTQTYLYFANNAYQIKTAKAGEFVTIDLVGIGLAQGTQDSSFSFTNSTQVDYPLPYTVDTRGYDTLMSARSGTIPCPGDGSTSYVYQNPAVAGKTVVSSEPPNAKTIHVIVPVTDDWQAAVPMISLDGTYASAKMLSADPDRCGWYTYTFFDEPINDNLYLVRDDDTEMEEVIGDNGYSDEEDVSLTPIPLKSLFEIFEVNDLYFVPDRAQWEDFPELETYHGWMDHDAIELEGTCNYNLAAIIYDTDASLHGAFTCAVPWRSGITPDEEKGNGCKVAGAKYAFTTAVTPCVGVTQGMVEEELDATTKKPKLTAKGLKCFGGNAEAFEVMFKSTPGINELSCYDMPFERSDDGKWEFDSDNYKSAGVKAVGGFYPVETTTDATVEGTPTPAARTKRMAEGPVFYHSYLRQNDPKTGVPRIDIVCNGPGWNGGHDCEGEFQSGGDLDNPKAEGVANFLYSIYPQIGAEGAALRGANCWGDYCNADAPKGWPMFVKGTEDSLGTEPRWTSDPNGDSKGTGRNQHFCFESHANFKYRAGLKFTFRGDDDIWVYIGNKLAVDLGGTHLAAPAYVDLDYFGKKNGLEVGETYDLDIFFCDRRTTMSNVRIKTNMFIKQSSGLDYTPKTIASGEKEYRLCYTETGDNSCASFVAGSTGKTKKECGDSISVPIRYYITNKSGSFGPYELTE
ncbi:MAG: fibro-slime domain-containing protein, partial [Fibrobacteraceae bacterium]|nr:fibro-slime domain-containing protein [Fibrobacteraceae bacterium]